VLGYEPEEIVGHKYFYEMAPPEDRNARRRQGLASIRAGGTMLNHENRMLSKEGRIVWVQTSGVSLLKPDGTHIFRGSDTDITSRKEAEAELRQWDRLLQATASGAQQLLAAPDLEVAVPSVLRTIGEACNQDRIYIF
jgi:PAS domain S-box-containing protein